MDAILALLIECQNAKMVCLAASPAGTCKIECEKDYLTCLNTKERRERDELLQKAIENCSRKFRDCAIDPKSDYSNCAIEREVCGHNFIRKNSK